ncbi:hypothetical protein QLQ12_27780 [Actinoplanes sp. NEAU-A12]|uniref:DUF3040 domain-containing protein n=1 Tax=Actinoplanes sandaracinus TaxID=3045177 RepID=A0ABT6WS18_9ACTN|nr:hypothetical protein [Actinoplanes sandaracinus]MDI6102425.1 hypothetical protein [Actinoplanes sandaracinus]
MDIPPIDAELALAEMRARREQVVETNLVPDWFWRAMGGMMLAFVAAVESEIRWLITVGTVVFTIVMAAMLFALFRKTRLQVRQDLLGLRGFVAIVAFSVGLTAVGIGLGLTLDALSVPFPGALALLPVCLGLAFGGPMLMAYLRKVMLSRPLASSR